MQVPSKLIVLQVVDLGPRTRTLHKVVGGVRKYLELVIEGHDVVEVVKKEEYQGKCQDPFTT